MTEPNHSNNESERTDAEFIDPESLLPKVYEELRSIAGRLMRRERSNHTLQPTALVHEAYVRLAEQTRAVWKNKGQFNLIAAQAMRRILVNHAVARKRIKRGGGRPVLTFEDGLVAVEGQSIDVIALDEVLTLLSSFDPTKARVVELRFFAGLSNSEIAQSLGISESTIKREWRFARVWLQSKLDGLNTSTRRDAPESESAS